MSAFMVSKACITRVIDGIFNCTYSPKGSFAHRCAASKYDELGRKLALLNETALQAQYGYEVEDIYSDYVYPMKFKGTSLVQSLKSAQCLLYQCDEGNVPDNELFKELEAFTHHLSKQIINALPEYSAADWG